jgi:hypothetical protein
MRGGYIMDTKNIILTDNCRFHLGDEPDAWMAWFDDSSWENVRLPHDWSVTLPFSKEYSSGTGYLAGGIGWYRIHISPKDDWRGKNISITFDGVYKNSRVWCNSYYMGERPNGYIGFTYDITEQFKYDEENIISVYVDHSDIADSRWFTGSGITRKVTLTVSEPIHTVHDGVFFSTPYVGQDSCTYEVECEVINKSDVGQTVSIRNVIYDDDNNEVTGSVGNALINSGETVVVKTRGEIANPRLWSPQTPYLYTLKTFIGGDEVYSAKVGLRSFYFDADKGFFLNGKPYIFKGVCVHHDAGCLGGAVLAEVWYRRLLKLKEMGCNAIRTSHNPHMPELYSLCDGLGFFVMDEAFDEWEAPKNKWSIGHNVYPPKHQGYYVNFPQWHEKDLVDMIRRDRNHPSVIMWSIGNEIDYPNDPYCHPSFKTMTGNNDANKPAAERKYNPKRPDASRLGVLSKMLCGIVKNTDTTHPVTLAAAFPELSTKLGFTDGLDVVGYNYKEHLYSEHHKMYPNKPLLGSENNHSYKAYRAVTDNEYISGQFLWTGIDYLGESRGYYPIHGSDSGLLTIAGFEKTGYWRRRSFWSDNSAIHLATMRESDCPRCSCDEEFMPVSECWNYIDGERVVVKCYTNLDEIELFINDKSLGKFKRDYDKDCIKATVDFEAGELRAQGVTPDGDFANFSLFTCECAVSMAIRDFVCDLKRYGIENSGLHQFEVTLIDRHGNRVYDGSTMLDVNVENGVLLGIENGDLADMNDYSFNRRRCYHGQLVVYALGDVYSDKKLKVTISGENLKRGIMEV